MGRILVKCSAHGLLPTAEVCAKCYQEQDNLIRVLKEKLAEAPLIINELFDEGMLYKKTLMGIGSMSDNSCCKLRRSGGIGHLEDCPRESAIAVLKGSGKKMLAKQTGLRNLITLKGGSIN